MGRLGNQLFEIATLYSMANRYKRQMTLPTKWKYEEFFKNVRISIDPTINDKSDIGESSYSFCGWEYWDKENSAHGSRDFNISGWMQSSKNWGGDRELIKQLFQFSSDVIASTCFKFDFPSNGKENILISVRVGQDYKDNGNYEILPITYQIGALYRHFPNWRNEYNVIVFADDYEYAKTNLDCSDNIYFAEGLSDIEQLYLGAACDHFILSNSTFCWWQYYLGKKQNSVCIRPNYYYKNYLSTVCKTDDFWEPEMIIYDHKNEKLDLSTCTFTIPVSYDHIHREENLSLILRFLTGNFKTNIIVYEQRTPSSDRSFKDLCGWMPEVTYKEFNNSLFHRTRMLNEMCDMSDTPIICNYDADNIVSPMQLMIAIDVLSKNEADMVYPFKSYCARVERDPWYEKLSTNLDCGDVFKGQIFRGARPGDPTTVGHIVLFNKEKFIEGGMENEGFVSYGPEDTERFERFTKLGYKIYRVGGITWHLDHYIGPNSSGANPHFGANYDQLERVRAMTVEDLAITVKYWNWVRKSH